MTANPIPDAIAPGLDLFVAAWLEEWTRYGGSVFAQRDGTGSIGWNPEPTGPGYAEPSADLPTGMRENTRAYNSAHHGGRMRAMIAMLDSVPHARQALQSHMRAHSLESYYGQVGVVK